VIGERRKHTREGKSFFSDNVLGKVVIRPVIGDDHGNFVRVENASPRIRRSVRVNLDLVMFLCFPRKKTRPRLKK
jgi:hypothetical protein